MVGGKALHQGAQGNSLSPRALVHGRARAALIGSKIQRLADQELGYVRSSLLRARTLGARETIQAATYPTHISWQTTPIHDTVARSTNIDH